MSTATKRAHAEFQAALKDSHNLIWFHEYSQAGKGRRHRQPALNRAAIVVTAAAWQAYIQDTTAAILSCLAVPPAHHGFHLYGLVRAATKTALGRFNTPNSRNTVDLLGNVGFDPEPNWAFTIGTPARAYSPQEAKDEIDGWLRVRHAIAHGASLPAIPLVSGRPAAGPSLHRADAERCIEFFERVVTVTAAAAHQQFP